MAGPRLPFLWPMLFRTTEMATARSRPAVQPRAFHSAIRRRQNTVQQRYGTANEPIPNFPDGKGGIERSAKTSGEQAARPRPKAGDSLRPEDGKEALADQQAEREPNKSDKDAKRDPITTDTPPARMGGDPAMDSAEAMLAPDPPPGLKTAAMEKPKESLLDSVPEPGEAVQGGKEEKKDLIGEEKAGVTQEKIPSSVQPPHMDAPRHVHHFDTYSLVTRLSDGGWKEDRAITAMKAMRLMLADNMDLAGDALVSKSQVENETYLFKAACSELKTEVTARRKAEQERMRTQRTHLQHEVDILNQRLGQDGAALKDELKGMFDDRKMAVRNEQRDMERKIQELNYKITVSLQADSKSDVEGLRWVMTRRVIITLGLIVTMVLSSLKLSSNAMHERELEEKRRSRMRTSSTQTDRDGLAEQKRRVTGEGEMLVREGDNPAFVSLG